MAKGPKSAAQAPGFLCGRLVFEFFNNDDEDFKNNTVKRVGKELRKELNVSFCTVKDTVVDDPERISVAVALTAPSRAEAKALADKVSEFLDKNMPGRLTGEDWEELESL